MVILKSEGTIMSCQHPRNDEYSHWPGFQLVYSTGTSPKCNGDRGKLCVSYLTGADNIVFGVKLKKANVGPEKGPK